MYKNRESVETPMDDRIRKTGRSLRSRLRSWSAITKPSAWSHHAVRGSHAPAPLHPPPQPPPAFFVRGKLFAVSRRALDQLGYTTTYVIGTLALPTFTFLFYAAVKKGQAEVDEDDARYSRGL